ncbi:peptidyl-tRNA hydrolase PTH2-domain-containing protein [Schizophyllum amplum]|uniref:peptidyl-tRNA hydrolase n=1 Tax=Schizophyllum amplum TaxID=97359 RepID=A0A550C9E3_9AGAR|nr:peptidyl-tRNA hydrolase PTH2-domain-containing protein [Auriculariopsis ampla]
MSYTQILSCAAVSLACLGIGFLVGTSETEADIACEVAATSAKSADPDVPEPEQPGLPDGDLSAVKAGLLEPCKLVLVVRTDLKLTHSTVAERCVDATLACYKALIARNPQLVKHWERTGQAKIALKGSSQKQLDELERTAKSLNLCARVVKDENKTKGAPSIVLAIGPAPVELVNRVTGKLRLL